MADDVNVTFHDLGLSEPVQKAVDDAGYVKPTPIQAAAIPKVLQGRDILGSAQTGTGKTASFTLPMIDILQHGRARARMPRSLILEPTRELATQVSENFDIYGKNCRLTKALLIGGVSFEDQARIIDRGADVLIATPGRLIDHFERGALLLRGVDILVIDEADRMLDMGFIPDVEKIISLCNPKRQTLLFSATMPKEIKRLADKFLSDPAQIEVAPPDTAADTVEQSISFVGKEGKREALRQLLRTQDVKNAFIFCNRKRDVDVVYRSLLKHGFNAGAMHGDLSQSYRTETLEKFKNGEIRLLVCSDVAARGIDVQGLSHVFLFDLPVNAEDYVHRIGRTGRAGLTGRAFSLATRQEQKLLTAVEKMLGHEIPRFDLEKIGISEEKEEAAPAKRESKKKEARKPQESEKKEARKPQESEKPARKSSRSRRRMEEPDEPVIGMGDHVPAFLLRTREKTS